VLNDSEKIQWEKAEIYSITGKLLQSVSINQSNFSISLPSDLSSGIYLISLENKGIRSQSQKLIISK
ncbi:MAG: T9SS type A sorting domain-containing protein, partial [Bacteroidia bacterium]